MKRTMTAVLAAIVVATGAHALTTTQSDGWVGDLGNVDATYTFNQFDDVGGTLILNSIEILVEIEITGGQRTIDNDDTDGVVTGTVELGINGGISSPHVSLVDLTLNPIGSGLSPNTSGSVTVDDDDGDTEVGGTPNVSVVGPDADTYTGGDDSENDSGFVAPAAWAGYLGTGTYDIDADFTAYTDFTGFGGIQDAGEPPTTDGTVTVKYNYTQIPEPATSIFFVLAGLTLLRRRR